MNCQAGLIVLYLAMLSLITIQRNEVWQNPRKLWESAIQQAPLHSRPRLDLARDLITAHDYDGARLQYETILENLGRVERSALYRRIGRHSALTNLGLLDVLEGNYARGEKYLNVVIAEEPDTPYPWINRGMARLAMGRFEEACSDFRAAQADAPTC